MEQKLRPTSPKSPEYQEHQEKIQQRMPVFTYILMSTVVSILVAGIATFLLLQTNIFSSNTSSIATVERQISSLFSTVRADGSVRADTDAFIDVIGLIYTQQPALDRVDTPVGQAIALTQDGWFVTSATDISGSELTMAFINGQTVSVDKTIVDGLTGLTFVHIDRDGGQVASMVTIDDFIQLDTVTAVEASVGNVIAEQLPVAGLKSSGDQQLSTTELHQQLQVDSQVQKDVTVPVFSSEGLFAGFLHNSNTVMPASIVLPRLYTLLESEQTEQVDMLYISLSYLTTQEKEEQQLPENGWYITAVNDATGFTVASDNSQETETVALAAGDVITHIQGREVDMHMDLSHTLFASQSGALLTMKVLRNGRTFDVFVEL